MLLCEEFATRNLLPVPKIRFVKKGFAFFGENNFLLVIKWMQNGPGPGFYEVSECSLEKNIRTIKVNNINWDEYKEFIQNWSASEQIVTDRKKIFNLTWEYFIRRNENFFLKKFGPEKIFSTIDCDNSNRIYDSISILEEISKIDKSVYDFWNAKLSEVIYLYCYWLEDAKKL